MKTELPGIISETPAEGTPGLGVRVVPNKFSALLPQPDADEATRAGQSTLPGFGSHEVVIECPRHDADLATMTRSERLAVASMYRERSRVLLGRPRIETVVLFRNRGSKAGASQTHPHSQIVALGIVPPRLNEMSATGLCHFQNEGRCASCAELDIKRRDGRRIVEENAICGARAISGEYPIELWIVPKQHRASFTEVDDEELGDWSDLLRSSLHRLKAASGDAAYRMVVESAPRSEVSSLHLHWRLRIVPEIVTWGGFERGSGMAINPSSPEDDAAVLRAANQGQATP